MTTSTGLAHSQGAGLAGWGRYLGTRASPHADLVGPGMQEFAGFREVWGAAGRCGRGEINRLILA